MQYSDDLGRVYFYNSVTQVTTWDPPPGVEISPPATVQPEYVDEAVPEETPEERAE